MDHPIEYPSFSDIYDYTSDDDYILTENTIVYYIWNNMYDLKHHINHEYINDDPITVEQSDNIMRFLYEIS
uniref:Uncharacterized protein n=1 Tax=viral metagenome TaxID=1070528 RepID=A0A6C0JJQ4_9ZZZZ